MRRNILAVPVRRVQGSSAEPLEDLVAVEEPLEIRIGDKPVSVTMRTPGQDRELAVGFLFGEGIIRSVDDVARIDVKGDNAVSVLLHDGAGVDTARLDRNFYVSSSCGVCGKASIEAVRAIGCAMLPRDGFTTTAEVVHSLPDRLRQRQTVFDRTGGLHAAALFDSDGSLRNVWEDIGRHNAVDKVIGNEVLSNRIPVANQTLLVSGRASFELIQKAIMARIPVLAAVGAPSSLAVDLALRFQMTLIGFVREDHFNIYSGVWRIR